MKFGEKRKVLVLLGIFAAVMLFFAVHEVADYIRYKNGVSVQGTVTDVDSAYRHHGGRRWYADVTATIDGVAVEKRLQLPRSGVRIGGVRMTGAQIEEGDTIELLAVRDGDGYDVASADDVRNPWPELLWQAAILGLIGYLAYSVLHKTIK